MKYILFTLFASFALVPVASAQTLTATGDVIGEGTAISVDAISVQPVTVDAPVATDAVNIKLFAKDLRKGQTSNDIAELQAILATDPSVYPEGITSGYFGGLTESALKRLQAKYDLPQTGVLDEATKTILYPTNIRLRVIQPNGGEEWTSGTSRRILWESTFSPAYYEELGLDRADVEALSIARDYKPFFGKVSVDLIRDSRPHFQYHIGTANIYDSGIAWKIPTRLEEAKDYRVRISVGGHVPCLYRLHDEVIDRDLTIAPPCPLIDIAYSGQDTSDRPFAILDGKIDPPNDEIIAKLKRQINAMQETTKTLLRQLEEMGNLLNEL